MDRYRIDHRRELRRDILHDDGGGCLVGKIVGETGIANQDQSSAASGDFLHVRDRFFAHGVIGSDDDHRHVLVDERDRPMFQLPRRIAFGMNIGNFLEFQRPFERQGIGRAAAEIKHVADLGDFPRQDLRRRFRILALAQ